MKQQSSPASAGKSARVAVRMPATDSAILYNDIRLLRLEPHQKLALQSHFEEQALLQWRMTVADLRKRSSA